MLVIKIELHSAVTGKISEIGRMNLWNDATEPSHARGNYDGQILRAPEFDRRAKPTRAGRVENYPRLAKTVWELVAEMLINMGYGKRAMVQAEIRRNYGEEINYGEETNE